MPEARSNKPQLHEEIAKSLRKEILREAVPGKKLMPDEAQARRFGVSVITVRDSMRILVKEGLLERRRGSGTYVKDRSNANTLGRVAVIASSDWFARTSAGSYQNLLMHALQEKLNDAKLIPDVHYEFGGELAESAILHQMPEAPLVGIVILSAKSDLARLTSFGVPVVSCDRSRGRNFAVRNDHAGMIRDATRYMIEKGRRRLALLTISKSISSHKDIDDWMEESFLATLAQHGIDFRTEFVAAIPTDAKSGTGFSTFQRLWKSCEQPPDGLLISDDSIYSEVAMAILKMGIRVPEDLMVVTHDNIGSGMFCPFATTRFAFDPKHMAEVMVEKLKSLMKGETLLPPFTMLPFQINEPVN